jgi:hypothetical protein
LPRQGCNEIRRLADCTTVRLLYTAGFIVWASAVTFGFVTLWGYEIRPGVEASAPAIWPDETKIPRPATRPALIVLLHPQCSCSQATVAELARLRTNAGDRADIHVLMLAPLGAGGEWVRSRLWDQADASPGVRMISDHEGTESRHFGAATSGQVLLYDTAGRLQFAGGITNSRGHEGDNPGRDALERQLRHQPVNYAWTRVFGCPLFSPERKAAR